VAEPSFRHPAFSAVLLAAGRSIRMGRDKALLEVGGRPLWQRQRDVLVQAGAAEVFLSARPDQAWAQRAQGFTAVLHDAIDRCGPLVGVTAALERASHPWVAVLAVDLPALPVEWFTGLMVRCTAGTGIAGRRGGYFEPLAAVYPRELRFPAWEAIARGDFSLQHVLAAAHAQGLVLCHDISDREAPWFENWNEV
jgi:molybdopterin-guanine dinucleotide biosynthesis protein A